MRWSLLTSLQRFPAGRPASGPPLALWLRRAGLGKTGIEKGAGGPHEGQADLVAHDVERHGVYGDATGDLPQSRPRVRLPHPMGQGLCHRLAGGGRDRVHDHAKLPPADRPHRRAPGADGLMLSAPALARRIEAGELTPRAVVEMCAEAIAAHENEIGAFTVLDIESARRTADGLASRPLRGLPVGMKDIFDTVDFPTAYGSAIYAGHRPKSDAAMVMAVRRAGGVLLGRTLSTRCARRQRAGARIPRQPAHVPGGSSSGSAAAIAAGMVPITFGSQTGGSVIRPAAYCGVAGYKPSFRLLPTIGMKAFSWSLDTVGVFGAGVEDVAFAAAAATGRDLRIDGLTANAPAIALLRTSMWSEASPDMQAAIERAARAAEAAGARVTELVLPEIFEETMRCHG